MTDATDELDRRIAAAMAALHGARAAAWHSPSAHNCAVMDKAERTVDELLDCRLALSEQALLTSK